MVIEPGNNVNSANGTVNKARNGSVRQEGQSSSKARGSDANNQDNVSLSNAAHSLNRLEAALANVTEVDTAKVKALKTAVENGGYQIDSYQLAGKILAEDDL